MDEIPLGNAYIAAETGAIKHVSQLREWAWLVIGKELIRYVSYYVRTSYEQGASVSPNPRLPSFRKYWALISYFHLLKMTPYEHFSGLVDNLFSTNTGQDCYHSLFLLWRQICVCDSVSSQQLLPFNSLNSCPCNYVYPWPDSNSKLAYAPSYF